MSKQTKNTKAEWLEIKAISEVSQILAAFQQEIFDNGAEELLGNPEFMVQEVLIANMEHFFGFMARSFDGNDEEFAELFTDLTSGLEERLLESAMAEKVKSDGGMVRPIIPA
jgi:hypothetical protein